MSRPKYYWNGIVKSMIKQYPYTNSTATQELVYKAAIDKAIEETRKLPNGEERLQAIQRVYFDKVLTLNGAAMELHYSCRTIQTWLNSFVTLVGRKVGY